MQVALFSINACYKMQNYEKNIYVLIFIYSPGLEKTLRSRKFSCPPFYKVNILHLRRRKLNVVNDIELNTASLS